MKHLLFIMFMILTFNLKAQTFEFSNFNVGGEFFVHPIQIKLHINKEVKPIIWVLMGDETFFVIVDKITIKNNLKKFESFKDKSYFEFHYDNEGFISHIIWSNFDKTTHFKFHNAIKRI